MPTTLSVQVFYTGRVQGVGFRYSVKQIASGYELVGSVRNLPDGRVALLASGEATEVEAFLDAVSKSQLSSYIKHVERSPFDSAGDGRTGFEIKH